MAPGVLAKPGSKYGPCPGTCVHTDCRVTRRMAAAICPLCSKPIGFGTAFYDTTGKGSLEHAYCTERATEAGRR